MSSESMVDPSAVPDIMSGVPQHQGQGPPQPNPNQGQAQIKRDRPEEDDDDDEDRKPGSRERRKIEIKFINDKSRRHITFSKRKAGIMKKAYELSVLTGTQVLLLVVSETGLVYTFTTPKLQPLVTKSEGKNLIQACLNAPETDPTPGQSQGLPAHMQQPGGPDGTGAGQGGIPGDDGSAHAQGHPPPPGPPGPPTGPPGGHPQQQMPPAHIQQQLRAQQQHQQQHQQQQAQQQPPNLYMSAEAAAAYNHYLAMPGQQPPQGQQRYMATPPQQPHH